MPKFKIGNFSLVPVLVIFVIAGAVGIGGALWQYFQKPARKAEVFVGEPIGTELVLNGGFENGQTNWSFEGGGLKEIVTTGAGSGSKSLHVKGITGQAKARAVQGVALENGKNYAMSLLVRGNTNAYADEWCVGGAAGNTYIKGQGFTPTDMNNIWYFGTWSFVAGNCNADQTHHLAIFFDAINTQEIWADEVSLKQTASGVQCPNLNTANSGVSPNPVVKNGVNMLYVSCDWGTTAVPDCMGNMAFKDNNRAYPGYQGCIAKGWSGTKMTYECEPYGDAGNYTNYCVLWDGDGQYNCCNKEAVAGTFTMTQASTPPSPSPSPSPSVVANPCFGTHPHTDLIYNGGDLLYILSHWGSTDSLTNVVMDGAALIKVLSGWGGPCQ